jgi:hypothetical protein
LLVLHSFNANNPTKVPNTAVVFFIGVARVRPIFAIPAAKQYVPTAHTAPTPIAVNRCDQVECDVAPLINQHINAVANAPGVMTAR